MARERKGKRAETVSELHKRATKNGYKKAAHHEVDRVPAKREYAPKGKREQDSILEQYIKFLSPEDGHESVSDEQLRKQYLGEGVKIPDLATVKDFFRFHAALCKPRLANVPTVDSLGSDAERFFAGFERLTKTEISADFRSEVYHWMRVVLPEEGVAANVKQPKYNFTLRTLDRWLKALWIGDDRIFIPDRYRIQSSVILHWYCWFGARLAAFFSGGVRYQDIQLALQRVDSGGWRLIYQLDQRWVKNNRDPDNISFGTAGKDHSKLIYNDAALILVLAITDGALFGYNSIEDLMEQEIPDGKDFMPLKWNNAAEDQFILQRCTKAEGVTDAKMPQSAFENIFQVTMAKAGYMYGGSIHTIRRQLGKKVDKRYTEVQCSQHLTQSDTRVFGQSYVANCSSIDGQGAFLGEQADHSHIEYFQSLEKFHETGLPQHLPAKERDKVAQKPELQELRSEVEALDETGASAAALDKAWSKVSQCQRRLERIALCEFQKQWMEDQREWKIVSRGKAPATKTHSRDDLFNILCLLMPERGRLAAAIKSKTSLPSTAMWQAIKDLYALCSCNLTVLYFPDHEPISGNCPVRSCKQQLDRQVRPSLW